MAPFLRRVGGHLKASASGLLRTDLHGSRLPVSSPARRCPTNLSPSAWACPRPEVASAAPLRRIPPPGFTALVPAFTPARQLSSMYNKKDNYLPLVEQAYEAIDEMKLKLRNLDAGVWVFNGILFAAVVGVPVKMTMTNSENQQISAEIVQAKSELIDVQQELTAMMDTLNSLEERQKALEDQKEPTD